MRCLLVTTLTAVGLVLPTSFAVDDKPADNGKRLFQPISVSPDHHRAFGVSFHIGHTPKIAKADDGAEWAAPVNDDSGEENTPFLQQAALVAWPSKKPIKTIDGRGRFTGKWSRDSKYLIIHWDVYKWDWGTVLLKSSGTDFNEVQLPERTLHSTLAKDTEFNDKLAWIYRAYEWSGDLLKIECIPLSSGEAPHPFAQDAFWYSVELATARGGGWRAVALHATHGNYDTDGTEIRKNPIWKSDDYEKLTGQKGK